MAAGAGHGDLCERLVREGRFKWTAEAAQSAARGGFVELTERAVAALGSSMAEPLVRDKVLEGAAEGCELQTLLWLHTTWVEPYAGQGPAGQPTTVQAHRLHMQQQQRRELIVAAAAASPTPDWRDKVEWLRMKGYPATRAAVGRASFLPDALHRVACLRDLEFPLQAHMMTTVVAKTRRLDLLELLPGGAPSVLDSVGHQAADADLAFLRELYARGARLNGPACLQHAVRSGDLEAVEWVLERFGEGPGAGASGGAAAAAGAAGGEAGVGRNSKPARRTATLFAAGAASGRMEMLEWLLKNGCPWDESVFAAAAGAGSEEQIEWLVERRCPMGADGAPYLNAAKNGDLATLKLLHRLGCSWGPFGTTFTAAVAWACELAVLEWLLQSGCSVDWEAAVEAAEVRQRPLGVVPWLQEQRQKRRRLCAVQ